jgi:serine/threonine protein kinase
LKILSDNQIRHLIDVVDRPDFSATKYRIQHEIARGGMGTLFLAEDTLLSREVAIKVLNTSEMNPQMVERMRQEAGIIARLEHPGIVPVHDLGSLPDGRVYYVMKYVRGKRLDHHVETTLSLTERLRLFRTACEAVAFAHAHGVIHRDLKPENIMIGPFGEVLIMDWGIAKLLDQDDVNPPIKGTTHLTSTSVTTDHGTVLGTPAYMAPEQSSGEIALVDRRADVYSLGAILYFLLTGSSIADEGRSGNFRHSGTVGFLVTRRLAAICAMAMATQREARYADAEELSREIDRFLDGRQIVAYRENIAERALRWIDGHRFIVYLLLAYLLMRAFLILAMNR